MAMWTTCQRIGMIRLGSRWTYASLLSGTIHQSSLQRTTIPSTKGMHVQAGTSVVFMLRTEEGQRPVETYRTGLAALIASSPVVYQAGNLATPKGQHRIALVIPPVTHPMNSALNCGTKM